MTNKSIETLKNDNKAMADSSQTAIAAVLAVAFAEAVDAAEQPLTGLDFYEIALTEVGKLNELAELLGGL